ncbi:ABC transporter substrate-binding protein [Thiobacillus denitrificans]|uniref:ABC transporter substrate-binding protein n=2 Tax=Thiobacillus denitrificans TaxID=36861 RepID=A0A106BPG5_THIDE|nr:ABC transporter substrate-binding protein [Thiobacillus denitrificans]
MQTARLLVGVLLLIAGIQPACSADKPLSFGVFPHLTARQTVETYSPLADALEKHLRRRVAIYTARDFKTFVERTRQGEYDILLTAPHLAWLARQDAGYRPLLKYAQPVRGLLVVKADSPFYAPDALRGRTIATPDPIAVVVLALHAELAANELSRNIDYQTTDSGTHLNAVMQVINGRADAAMLGLPSYRLMPPELRQQLRVLAETPPLSSLMYLTHPRLRDAEAQAVRKTLLSFATTPEGQAFMQRGGFGGFADVDGNELQAFRPYALQVQEMLRAPQ